MLDARRWCDRVPRLAGQIRRQGGRAPQGRGLGPSVTTVFYRDADGARLGYSVVGGVPLDETPAGREVVREGNTYHVADAGPNTVVTWTQQGHTCVIVAPHGVPAGQIVELAASRNV